MSGSTWTQTRPPERRHVAPAHPRKPPVSAAALPRAPAMVFPGSAGVGVFFGLAVGFLPKLDLSAKKSAKKEECIRRGTSCCPVRRWGAELAGATLLLGLVHPD